MMDKNFNDRTKDLIWKLVNQLVISDSVNISLNVSYKNA